VHHRQALLPRKRHRVRMAEWKNEEDIKAQLRELTSELRRLREELQGMVEPAAPHPTRAFLHRQTWPPQNAPAVVADRRKRRSRKDKEK
jgi:hypothetical protein